MEDTKSKIFLFLMQNFQSWCITALVLMDVTVLVAGFDDYRNLYTLDIGSGQYMPSFGYWPSSWSLDINVDI